MKLTCCFWDTFEKMSFRFLTKSYSQFSSWQTYTKPTLLILLLQQCFFIFWSELMMKHSPVWSWQSSLCVWENSSGLLSSVNPWRCFPFTNPAIRLNVRPRFLDLFQFGKYTRVTEIPSAVWMENRIFIYLFPYFLLNMITNLLNYILISMADAFQCFILFFHDIVRIKVCCIKNKCAIWTHYLV